MLLAVPGAGINQGRGCTAAGLAPVHMCAIAANQEMPPTARKKKPLTGSDHFVHCVILYFVDTREVPFSAKIWWKGAFSLLFLWASTMEKTTLNCYHCNMRIVYTNVCNTKKFTFFLITVWIWGSVTKNKNCWFSENALLSYLLWNHRKLR